MSTTPTANPPAKMPKQIPYIIGNEGCERFSFYGMRNILMPFLTTFLLATSMPDEVLRKAYAKDVFHTFVIGVYFFPLLGGWVADKFLGKYNTIFIFSLIYCAGHACLAIFENSVNGFFVGLGLIALGAGGIKPLVASFMGDQFDSTNKHLAKIVFDAFYWIINFGSFFASMLMPLFLMSFGPSIAFLIPGVLMFIATVVLWLGRNKYVLVPVKKTHDPHSFLRVVASALRSSGPGESIRMVMLACAIAAIVATTLSGLGIVLILCLYLVIIFFFGGIATSTGLDNIRGRHPDEAIEGVRSVLRILIVFALVTPFHSLFDQKASTWVLQGDQMTLPSWTFDPTGRTAFQPAQMQMFNPLLVMILIPFNNLVLYPWLRKIGWNPTPIRRMTFGILFSAFAWVAAGVIQLALDDGNKLDIMWQLLPYALLTFGEVLVSATGLEFAYSQAPLAMKGVIMSFWNLTTTIGNLWVLLVNAGVRDKGVLATIKETGLSETAFLMFFFAVFAFLATVAFWLYTRRYRVLDNYRAVGGGPPDGGPKAPLPTATAREK
jgi:POT family proton-dependent oligopeptide transporter